MHVTRGTPHSYEVRRYVQDLTASYFHFALMQS